MYIKMMLIFLIIWFVYKVLDKRKSGFPYSAITKVTNMLEEKKISYQIIYDNKDPFVKNYRNLNLLWRVYEKGNG